MALIPAAAADRTAPQRFFARPAVQKKISIQMSTLIALFRSIEMKAKP
jgi:hypothetical protein